MKQHKIGYFLRCYKKYCTSGPQGVDGRLPSTFGKYEKCVATSSLAITDPFNVYQGYVNMGKLKKDESQLRVMKEFQKLYHRLIDYRPENEISIKRSLLVRKLEILKAEELKNLKTSQDKPLHKFRQLFQRDIESKKQEIVRFMTDEEELQNIPSPQGLLVNGEVGCGKSMLMDIFATSLPHASKMRWHYNNFILWVFGEIHRIQKERMLTASVAGKHKMTMENEFILFEIAQKMIDRSTVFILDEFMLPDVASAQIVRILFTYYFKLGGVLVATSNKLPEELYSSGFNKSRFSSFVGILNSRCISVDMNSDLDYRHHFAQISSTERNMVVKELDSKHEEKWKKLVGCRALGLDASVVESQIFTLEKLPWFAATLTVYNRALNIPKTLGANTVCFLDFDYICKGLFSSSDYISLASTYRTVIIDDVPVMTTKMKNEARRFITLLDALYEARCKLFLRTEVQLEHLFFPKESEQQVDSEVVQQEEMYAKTSMQTLNPYRPNVTSYDQYYAKKYNEEDNANQPNANFANVKAFTGEDEKFAFKRAVSRIREMVASDHWCNSDKWVPIDDSMRPWEKQSTMNATRIAMDFNNGVKDQYVPSQQEIKRIKNALKESLPRELSTSYATSFREFNQLVSPRISNLSHFWGIGEWTIEQQRKIKDKIAQTWVSGGIRSK